MLNLYLHKTEHGKRLKEISDEDLQEGITKGEIEIIRKGLYRQVAKMEYQRRDMVAETHPVRRKKRGRKPKEEIDAPAEDESE